METSIGTVVVAENPIFNPDLEVGGTESLKNKETVSIHTRCCNKLLEFCEVYILPIVIFFVIMIVVIVIGKLLGWAFYGDEPSWWGLKSFFSTSMRDAILVLVMLVIFFILRRILDCFLFLICPCYKKHS